MNCDEFRRYWLDREPVGETGSTQTNAHLTKHREDCASCQTWLRQERDLDRVLGPALIVAPPPDLAFRLAQIPLAASAPGMTTNHVPPLGLFLEAAFLVMVGLGAIGLSAAADSALLALAIDRLGGILQAIPLVFNAPLVSYAESFVVTMVEAVATLILVALGLLQVRPFAASVPQRESALE